MTPTGALLVSDFAESYGGVPAMRLQRVGYGAGSRDFPRYAERAPGADRRGRARIASRTTVVVIEAEIDDMNPQIFGVLMDRLLARGRARRVLHADSDEEEPAGHAAYGRCAARGARAADVDRSSARRTTIGVRYREMDAECLDREDVDGPDAVWTPCASKWRGATARC